MSKGNDLLHTAMKRRSLLKVGLLAGVSLWLSLPQTPTSPPPLVTRCRFGAYAGGSHLVQDHRDLETLVGARLPVFSWFKDWGGGWNPSIGAGISGLSGEPVYDCMIAWESGGVLFADILSGKRDKYITDFIDGAKTYPGRVILRLFPEMNGNWQPWSVDTDRSLVASPAQWRQTWRYVVALARTRRASNVTFLFCANTNDVGSVQMEAYWPGAYWVDAVGLDGYNWAWNADGTPQQTAEQVIEPMYDRLSALHPIAEFMICETGCAEHPNKADWYRSLYSTRKFHRLTQVAFFNANKERDWRLNSDPATLAVNRLYLPKAPV